MKKIKELLLLLVKCLLLMTASIISAFLCYQLGILGLHIYDGEAPIVFFLLVGVGFFVYVFVCESFEKHVKAFLKLGDWACLISAYLLPFLLFWIVNPFGIVKTLEGLINYAFLPVYFGTMFMYRLLSIKKPSR